MKICLFSKNYGALDGCAQSVFDVIVSLLESGVDLRVMYNKNFPDISEHDGFNIKEQFQIYPLPRKNLIDSIFYNKKRFNKILEINPHVCIVNGISGHYFRSILEKDFCNNNIIIIRESPQLSQFKNEENSLKLMIKKMTYYQKFIFVSSNVMNQWKKLLDLNDKQICYIPNCINESKARQAKLKGKTLLQNELKFDKEKFNITCVASIQKRKGQDLIFSSIAKIAEKIPNIHFHIVGKEKKPDSDEMISMIPSNFLDYFTFYGSKNNAIEYLCASDAMILPSRSEAFPRVTLESMAVGTPVIISDVDGNTEQISHNQTGKIFSNENISELIKCIKDLYSNTDLACKLRENAMNYYINNFSRDKHIDNFKKYFQST